MIFSLVADAGGWTSPPAAVTALAAMAAAAT
jgi:hypothetical protein